MKYLKKYNESISTLNSLHNDELEEKLKWLRIEMEDIQDEISTINKILTKRKESKESKYSETLPDSIFDFNKEQLDWVFEHHHGTTSKRYSIAGEYLSELEGVMNIGTNPDTNQFLFTISSSSCMDNNGSGFENIVKSIKFLGDNLKRVDGYVKFKIIYYHLGYSDELVKYYSEDNIEWDRRYTSKKVTSIEDLLKNIVEYDIGDKEEFF